jgi:hypothetical protein
MKTYRHGDLIIKPIKKLPDGLRLISKGKKFVLAKGETTGHKHLLVAEPKTMRILQDANGKFYLDFFAPVKITHEEHKTLIIEPGLYEVGNEREYDYFLQEIRNVVD